MATATFSGSSNSMALLTILTDVTGSRKSKMAASKPEVLIAQLLDKIANSNTVPTTTASDIVYTPIYKYIYLEMC